MCIYIYIWWMAWRWSQHNRGTRDARQDPIIRDLGQLNPGAGRFFFCGEWTSRCDINLGYQYLALLYHSSSNGIFIPDWWTELFDDFHLGYSYLGYWDYVRDPPGIVPPMSVVLCFFWDFLSVADPIRGEYRGDPDDVCWKTWFDNKDCYWLVVDLPLWNTLVTWDDYSPYMGNSGKIKNVPNHQPDEDC